jgi:hypothetical protein
VLNVVKGFGASETGHAYARARMLWERLGSQHLVRTVPQAHPLVDARIVSVLHPFLCLLSDRMGVMEGTKAQIGVPLNVRVLPGNRRKDRCACCADASASRAEVLRQLITAGSGTGSGAMTDRKCRVHTTRNSKQVMVAYGGAERI